MWNNLALPALKAKAGEEKNKKENVSECQMPEWWEDEMFSSLLDYKSKTW